MAGFVGRAVVKGVLGNRKRTCGTCGGAGRLNHEVMKTCSKCRGNGKGKMYGSCKKCNGLGVTYKYVQQKCHGCGGKGKVKR